MNCEMNDKWTVKWTINEMWMNDKWTENER